MIYTVHFDGRYIGTIEAPGITQAADILAKGEGHASFAAWAKAEGQSELELLSRARWAMHGEPKALAPDIPEHMPRP